jgi:hypothetical protein
MALTRITSDGITDGTITGTDLATNIDLVDNQKLRLGTGNDLQIYHDGGDSLIKDAGTGLLGILTNGFRVNNAANNESMIKADENGAVELYYDNSKKFETTSTGVTVAGNVVATGNMQINDGNFLNVGNSGDLQIYHSSSGGGDSYITNSNGNLNIVNSTDGWIRLQPKSGEEGVIVKYDGAVELYHNNSKKFETTSTGATVTGTLAATNTNITTQMFMPDNGQIRLGNSDDLKIYHDGSNSFIKNSTGGLDLNSDTIHLRNGANSETYARFLANGAVELYFDNTLRFQTTSVGISVSGTIITFGEVRPADDNDHSIGLSNRRYTTIFAVNGSINTSDRTEKNTIVESDLGLDFINKLKPVSYKWNKDDGKTHYGLIAQDLEETLTSIGKTIADFGGIYKEADSPMGLGYSELISPLIKAIQELSAEVAALKAG